VNFVDSNRHTVCKLDPSLSSHADTQCGLHWWHLLQVLCEELESKMKVRGMMEVCDPDVLMCT
jgi:hypothetical protein